MHASDELLPLVDLDGNVIGHAYRREVHGNPTLMHPVVHCIVQNGRGDVLLQLRSQTKDVQPGRWDTSVGGHVGVGEAVPDAVAREVGEELGIVVPEGELEFLYRYVMRSEIETELVHTFRLHHAGPFRAETGEIDELRFWSREAIRETLGRGVFTPNFEDEFARYEDWCRGQRNSDS